MNPALFKGSLLAASSGERMYAPGRGVRCDISRTSLPTFRDSYNVSKWQTDIHFDLLEIVIITLINAFNPCETQGVHSTHNDVKRLYGLNGLVKLPTAVEMAY
jgi:hypothetical protein